MKNNLEKEQKIILKGYMDDILVPLDQFFSSHYKMLVKEQNTEILDQAYDLYFEKLEQFFTLVEKYNYVDEKTK